MSAHEGKRDGKRDGAREEGAASRALRALRVSGRRLVRRSDGWAVVHRDARLRPVMALREGEVLALVGSGLVMATAGGGYVLSPEAAERAQAQAAPVCFASGGGVAAMLAQERVTRRADFDGLLAMSRRGEGPLSLRAAMAGLRIVRDAEAASLRDGLTMNWSATPMERRRGAASLRGGLNDRAREASMRLERVAAALPEPGFAYLRVACVEGRRLNVAEARFGLAPRSGAAVLARLLECAADALDRGG